MNEVTIRDRWGLPMPPGRATSHLLRERRWQDTCSYFAPDCSPARRAMLARRIETASDMLDLLEEGKNAG